MSAAIEEARQVTDKPSLICCQTIIGFGSPNKQGKEECHGAALGHDEIALTREALGWPHAPFEIPADIYEGWSAAETGAKYENAWNDRFENYRAEFPELAAEFERRVINGELPKDWAAKSAEFVAVVAGGVHVLAALPQRQVGAGQVGGAAHQFRQQRAEAVQGVL